MGKNLKIAVMQPYFFPYIGYWQLIHAVDTFVIYDDVNYIKKGFINRNYIMINGKLSLFTLQVLGASQNKKINELTIGENASKILKTIENVYSASINYDHFFPVIHSIMTYENKNLAEFVGNSIIKVCEYLGLDRKLIYSSSLNKDPDLKGQHKIIEICKILDSKTYINPLSGSHLYQRELFFNKNIFLKFLEVKNQNIFKEKSETNYPSIVDILMKNKKSKIDEYLNLYKIVDSTNITI